MKLLILLIILTTPTLFYSQTKTIPVSTYSSVSMFGSKHEGVGGMPVLIGSETTTSILLSSNSHSTLSIVEYRDTRIIIYPNPAQEIVYFSNKADYVRLADVSGKECLSAHSTNSIDISGLAPGLYLINIITKTNKYNYQLIKL